MEKITYTLWLLSTIIGYGYLLIAFIGILFGFHDHYEAQVVKQTGTFLERMKKEEEMKNTVYLWPRWLKIAAVLLIISYGLWPG